MADLGVIGQFVTNPTDFLLRYARLQRNYLWDVLLPDVGINMLGLGGLAIGQLVQSVQFGDYSMDDIKTMRVGPYTANFAGMLSVQKIQMSFLKIQPDIVSMYFNAWKKLIVDENTGLFSTKSKYQKTIFVRFIDQSGIAFGRYKLIGCFPTSFPSYRDLNYESNTVTKLQIEFSVDKLEYEIL